MRSRRIVLSLLGAMVAVLLGPVGAAPAAVAFHGVTTTHADRMPIASEAWRQLREGRIDVETTFDTWTASARLGAAIPAGETVELTWTAGRRTDAGCTPFASFVEEFSTASEDHTVTTLRRTFDADDTIDPADPTPLCFEVSMRAGGIVSDVLVGGMTSDRSTDAIIGADASAARHLPGYPRTDLAWERLESASLRGDVVSGTYRLSATLGGPLPDGAAYGVVYTLGRPTPNGCEPLAGFNETNLHLDDTHTMTVEHRIPDYPEMANPFSCFEVTLLTADTRDAVQYRVSDMLTGEVLPIVADVAVGVAPAAGEIVVAAGRSTPVIVTATSRVGARKGLTVVGRGRGVRAPRTSTGAIEARRLRPVVVRVAAATAGRSRLALTARDKRFDVAHRTTRWPVVARRIEAQRPLPGRYTARRGSVEFRVTRDFVVRGLTVDGVRCAGRRVRPDARLDDVRLPRNGAAARVVRTRDPVLGPGFLGAQLLTTAPSRVVGTVVVATQSCEGSVRFSARRLG